MTSATPHLPSGSGSRRSRPVPSRVSAPQQVHDIGRRRARVIWLVGLAVYLLAIFHRSSLGVAGLIAADRFDISATQLAFFTVLQLVVYAGMQVPVGVLLDRYGSRMLLLVGLALMTGGQVAFAFANSFPVAVGARAVLGAIVAAAPLSLALHELGWTRSFAWAAAIGVPLMVLVAMLVKDSPYRRRDVVRIKLRALGRSLRTVWGNPGTRLGMWSHFTSQFSVTVFSMLWGFPFLVRGQGLSTTTASTLMMVMTGWVVVSGLVLGALTARYPFYRSYLVLAVVAAMSLCWGVVLLRSTPAPMWLLVVLVCLLATGGPASMVGFDLARSFTPVEMSGRANGFVNIGGFSAALLTMALVGILLDLQSGGSTAYDLGDFRVAMSVQYLFWGLGAYMILRYRRKAVAHLQRVHPGAVESMKRGEAFVHPGFSDREGV